MRDTAYRGGETGAKRIIFELGIVGFFVFYIFWAWVLLAMKKMWARLRDFEAQKLTLGILLFVVLILVRFTFVHHQVLGDSAVLASMWFFMGVFFKLTEDENITHSSDILPSD